MMFQNPFAWRNWPVPLLYFPLTIYIFSIGFFRTRRLFYFSAANPKISLGGFAGDSKSHILEHIPAAYKPKSIFVSQINSLEEVIIQMQNTGVCFPIIAKPDLGESGFLVKKITNEKELSKYFHQHQMDFIIQEFISAPLELSVLIHTYQGKLNILSITEREHFHVIGDGNSTLRSLILKKSQGYSKFKNISKNPEIDLNIVPAIHEKVFPNSIGNWDYGATYRERNNLISEKVIRIFQDLNAQINLFEFGRYDLKCQDSSSLESGSFKILEINGVKGEPIHIYDSKYTLLQAYFEIFKQWEIILQISKSNIKNGWEVPRPMKCFQILKRHVQTKKESIKPRKNHEQN